MALRRSAAILATVSLIATGGAYVYAGNIDGITADQYARIAATVKCYEKEYPSSQRKGAVSSFLSGQGLTSSDFKSLQKKYSGDANIASKISTLASNCSALGVSAPIEVSEDKEEEVDEEPAAAAEAERKSEPKKDRRKVKRKKKRSRPKPGKRPPAPQPVTPDTVVAPEGSTDWGVNPWTETTQDNLSTFAVDVDTGSYTIARRTILEGKTPDPKSVRVEEFVNYFRFTYPQPEDRTPFSVSFEGSPSPFNAKHHILRVGVQGRTVTNAERRPANLVFLVDVSGSMNSPDKLELAKRSLRVIVSQMRAGDYISLVTYAGNTRVVLPATGYDDRAKIETAIEDLTAGGSTAMESGMALAYEQALSVKEPGSINRVIVLSDGDANVGKTGHDEILKGIEGYLDQGITMSTVGFGRGNYQDTKMEQLANKGNGNYNYIDTLSQAKRVFQEQLGGTLQVIAKDVKIQVELNTDVVEKYRLIGYENRDIADEDFRNDTVDAGEIGAGHRVTALYEIVLKEKGQGDIATVRLRHKSPEAKKKDPAKENAFVFARSDMVDTFESSSVDHKLAVAVVAFAEVLRKSPAAKDWSLDAIAEIARETADGSTERDELLYLVQRVRELKD